MTQKVTIYTAGPECGLCTRAKTEMNRQGLDYDEVNLKESPEALAMVKGLKYQMAPVTLRTDTATDEVLEHWGGFRPDRIKAAILADLAPSGASPPWPPLGQQVSGPRTVVDDASVLAHEAMRDLDRERVAIDML